MISVYFLSHAQLLGHVVQCFYYFALVYRHEMQERINFTNIKSHQNQFLIWD